MNAAEFNAAPVTAIDPALAAAIADKGIPLSADMAETLAPWLYQRFTKVAPPWESLSEDDRSFWEHEAAAVRRAVARGGFKKADSDNDRRRRIYIDGKGDGWIDLSVDPDTGERDLAGISDAWKVASANEVRGDAGSLREIGRCW